jgi:hypothetical protein
MLSSPHTNRCDIPPGENQYLQNMNYKSTCAFETIHSYIEIPSSISSEFSVHYMDSLRAKILACFYLYFVFENLRE